MLKNRSNKKRCKWLKWSEKKCDFFSTLSATSIGVLLAFAGAYWISENQKSAAITQAQNQEVDSVVQLLEFAQKDVNRSVSNLDLIQDPVKQASKSEAVRAINAVFVIAVPYPTAFEKILDDDKIMRHLSDGAVLEFYSAQARLDSQRSHMLDPCASADKRLAAMKWYKRDLELVNTMLESEVEYQNKSIDETEMLKRYAGIQKDLSVRTKTELELLIKGEDRNSLCDIVRTN